MENMENNDILTLVDLCYYYKDGDTRRYILKDVSYTFEKGKFYTILGESGSGKTTLLSLMSALDKPNSGRVLYDGRDITHIGYSKYRRNDIGIIFQGYNLIPYMTATENVMVAMSITDKKLPKNKKETALNLLRYVGIDGDKATRPVTKLSGGEQQRVAVARAMATDVEVILADEPTGNLDEEKQAEVVQMFASLAHDFNKCIIAVTHSSAVASRSDCIVILTKGVLMDIGELSGSSKQPAEEQA